MLCYNLGRGLAILQSCKSQDKITMDNYQLAYALGLALLCSGCARLKAMMDPVDFHRPVFYLLLYGNLIFWIGFLSGFFVSSWWLPIVGILFSIPISPFIHFYYMIHYDRHPRFLIAICSPQISVLLGSVITIVGLTLMIGL